jgi:threonine dehydratase
VIVVPVGGGSGAAGACIVAKAINPAIRVIGVQSDAAPAAFRSWQVRRLVEDKMETCAEGLATRTAFELPQQILWRWLDDFVLVSDDEIRAAQALMIEATRNLVEAAGAAPLAAGLRLRERPDREARRDGLEWGQRQPRAACGGAGRQQAMRRGGTGPRMTAA